MYWLISSGDRWFLQANGSSAAVGVYAVACIFGQVGMMANSALLAIWVPEATRVHESGDPASEHTLAITMTRLFFLMSLVWLGTALFGSDLLKLLTASRYHSAAPLVPWIACAVFFYGCYHLANTGLFLSRNLKRSAFLWALAGCFSLAANSLFVPLYGMLAAAIVQCCTFALLAATVIVTAQRRLRLPLSLPRIGFGIGLVLSAIVGRQMVTLKSAADSLMFNVALFGFTSLITLFVIEEGLGRLCWRWVQRGFLQHHA
jgi:O-antigen/teichoic acid export membrane protein